MIDDSFRTGKITFRYLIEMMPQFVLVFDTLWIEGRFRDNPERHLNYCFTAGESTINCKILQINNLNPGIKLKSIWRKVSISPNEMI